MRLKPTARRSSPGAYRWRAPAAIYSVIDTVKINGIWPQAYIADVIPKIVANWPAKRWDELLTWNWQPPINSTSRRQPDPCLRIMVMKRLPLHADILPWLWRCRTFQSP
ncbi:transposase domain-containing protein [Novosphingobium sp. Gsoil 351]|uniref:transposase domain-containing protein n=1 Tax=Novosphingobium sp. Gsoil 351 TaxID=2675225 RepID=UPI00351BC525